MMWNVHKVFLQELLMTLEEFGISLEGFLMSREYFECYLKDFLVTIFQSEIPNFIIIGERFF